MNGIGSAPSDSEQLVLDVFNCTRCDQCVKERSASLPFLSLSGTALVQVPIKVLFLGQNPGKPVAGEHAEMASLPRDDPKTILEWYWRFWHKSPTASYVLKLVNFLGIDPSACVFSNIVRCWLADFQTPSEQIIDNCSQYTERLIKLLNPRIVITFGSVPSAYFAKKVGFGRMPAITTILGNKLELENYIWIPHIHPSYARHVAAEEIEKIQTKLKNLTSSLTTTK